MNKNPAQQRIDKEAAIKLAEKIAARRGLVVKVSRFDDHDETGVSFRFIQGEVKIDVFYNPVGDEFRLERFGYRRGQHARYVKPQRLEINLMSRLELFQARRVSQLAYDARRDVEAGYKQAAKAALEATGVEVGQAYATRGWSIGLNLRDAGNDRIEVESYSLRYIGGGALRSIEQVVRPTPEAVLEAVTRIQQFNTEANWS